MEKLVSIIIPTYSHGPLLSEAIDSALVQDYPFVEIIVVNDGSPDDTWILAESYGDQIIYIEQENRGVASARNIGIRHANGSYIAFLDGDDVLVPGSIACRAEFLDTHDEVSLVCGNAEILGLDGVDGLHSIQSGKPRHTENFRWETIDFCALPSTVMVRAQALHAVGLFDEEIKKAGAEDWNLWVRMSLQHNMAYLDQVMARWRVQGQNTSNNISLLRANSRYAVGNIVNAPYFNLYPRHFRARLLYFQFACTWRSEPKNTSLGYLWCALRTDPKEIGYGMLIMTRGLRSIFHGFRSGIR